LGRNTCYELGIELKNMVVYDPRLTNGGLTSEEIQKAKVILWYGYCSVHQGFTKEHIDQIKITSPETNVIVHPECSFEVVQAADFNGSTSYIIETIKKSKSGTKWAVGTEINLVNRLNNEIKDKEIISLSPYQCMCTTMYRVRPRWLLHAMRSVLNNKPINIIKVNSDLTKDALIALETMFKIV
jgi:quinolinate synthase